MPRVDIVQNAFSKQKRPPARRFNADDRRSHRSAASEDTRRDGVYPTRIE